MEVIEHIGETPPAPSGRSGADAPLKPVIIQKVEIIAPAPRLPPRAGDARHAPAAGRHHPLAQTAAAVARLFVSDVHLT